MRRLIVSEFLSLDGVMQAPGGQDEDRTGSFEHGGWQQQYSDEVFGRFVTQEFERTGGLLLGRVTYDIFAGYWPSAPADNPLAGTMNALPKYVVSTTLREPLSWTNSTLIADDVRVRVARLKKEDGQDLRVIGSGQARPDAHGARPGRRVPVADPPADLGRGKRLFRDGIPKTSLTLVDASHSTTGVIMARYVPANR